MLDLSYDIGVITTTLLVATRVGALLLMTPLFSTGPVPPRILVLFVLAFSLLLVLSFGLRATVVPGGLGALVPALANELVVGALMGFGLFSAFGAFSLAGGILDLQVGFSVGNVIDPVTESASSILGSVLNLMAAATFFFVDAHHLLLRALAHSFGSIPPGTGLAVVPLDSIVEQIGLMFSLGLALVAPTVFALFLIDVAMGIASRSMPQANMFLVGIPIKIMAALGMLILSQDYIGPVLERLFETIFRFWESFVG
jgi:flagellar biosynthetic protein FliR